MLPLRVDEWDKLSLLKKILHVVTFHAHRVYYGLKTLFVQRICGGFVREVDRVRIWWSPPPPPPTKLAVFRELLKASGPARRSGVYEVGGVLYRVSAQASGKDITFEKAPSGGLWRSEGVAVSDDVRIFLSSTLS